MKEAYFQLSVTFGPLTEFDPRPTKGKITETITVTRRVRCSSLPTAHALALNFAIAQGAARPATERILSISVTRN